jgi:hypothetical protein
MHDCLYEFTIAHLVKNYGIYPENGRVVLHERTNYVLSIVVCLVLVISIVLGIAQAQIAQIYVEFLCHMAPNY